ncbi:hypothetical protein AB1Y20_003932 [Prymnesium parvum]|uniref:Uncharacterized protein n=1 Tax=Prymnesium parvum TaxID=97485 RepID=A0AB34J951_PRYPA
MKAALPLLLLLLPPSAALHARPALLGAARTASRARVRCATADDDAAAADDAALQASLRARREAAKLDLPDAQDELAKAFRRRLDEEGGGAAFRLKSDAARAAEGVQEGAAKVGEAGRSAIDTASGWLSSLPPNAVRLLGIVLLLSFLPSIIGGLAGGVGGGGEDFYNPTYGQI